MAFFAPVRGGALVTASPLWWGVRTLAGAVTQTPTPRRGKGSHFGRIRQSIFSYQGSRGFGLGLTSPPHRRRLYHRATPPPPAPLDYRPPCKGWGVGLSCAVFVVGSGLMPASMVRLPPVVHYPPEGGTCRRRRSTATTRRRRSCLGQVNKGVSDSFGVLRLWWGFGGFRRRPCRGFAC